MSLSPGAVESFGLTAEIRTLSVEKDVERDRRSAYVAHTFSVPLEQRPEVARERKQRVGGQEETRRWESRRAVSESSPGHRQPARSGLPEAPRSGSRL